MIAVLLLFNASRAAIWIIGSTVLILNGIFIAFMYIHVGTEAAVQINTKDENEEGGSDENPWRARFKKIAMKVAFAIPKKLLKILKRLKETESKKVLRVIWGSGVEIGAIDTLKFFLAADEDGNGWLDKREFSETVASGKGSPKSKDALKPLADAIWKELPRKEPDKVTFAEMTTWLSVPGNRTVLELIWGAAGSDTLARSEFLAIVARGEGSSPSTGAVGEHAWNKIRKKK